MPETENHPVVDKVRELQRKLWVCAKQSKTRRFHALYDRIYRREVLREACRRVRSNGGAAGVDAETIQAIEESSFGFRPKQSATEALEAIRIAGNQGPDFVVDADIKGYFRSYRSRVDDEIRPAPRGRSPDPTADPEMAESRGDGGWAVVGGRDGYAARFGDLTAAGQYLSALRLRPLGGGLAQEVRPGRRDRRPLCG